MKSIKNKWFCDTLKQVNISQIWLFFDEISFWNELHCLHTEHVNKSFQLCSMWTVFHQSKGMLFWQCGQKESIKPLIFFYYVTQSPVTLSFISLIWSVRLSQVCTELTKQVSHLDVLKKIFLSSILDSTQSALKIRQNECHYAYFHVSSLCTCFL